MKDSDKLPNFDDTFDDALAAYKEVADRTSSEPAPVSQSADRPIDRSASEPEAISNEGKTAAPEAKAKDADADKPGSNRDASGRFTSKDGKGASEKGARGDKPVQEQDGAAPAASTGQEANEAQPVAGGPPPSWSVKAKASWDNLPAEVRADIAKREGEVAQGLAALRDYKDLKPYAERAQREGTTISKALDHFVRMEDMCRRDLGSGIALICQNMGLNQQQAAQMFASMAQKYGGTAAPAGTTAPAAQANDPLLAVLAPVLSPLQQELQALKGQLTARADADRKASEQSLTRALDKFANDPANRYYPDLQEQMIRLMETGMVPVTGNVEADIRAAYDLAARMNPEVSEALIEQRLQEAKAAERKREQEEVERKKFASRSVTGSRMPGTTITERQEQSGSYDDVEADARRAYRMHAQV